MEVLIILILILIFITFLKIMDIQASNYHLAKSGIRTRELQVLAEMQKEQTRTIVIEKEVHSGHIRIEDIFFLFDENKLRGLYISPTQTSISHTVILTGSPETIKDVSEKDTFEIVYQINKKYAERKEQKTANQFDLNLIKGGARFNQKKKYNFHQN